MLLYVSLCVVVPYIRICCSALHLHICFRGYYVNLTASFYCNLFQVEQTSNEFYFGSAVYSRRFNRASETKYRERFYENFEWAVPENSLKWRLMESQKVYLYIHIMLTRLWILSYYKYYSLFMLFIFVSFLGRLCVTFSFTNEFYIYTRALQYWRLYINGVHVCILSM